MCMDLGLNKCWIRPDLEEPCKIYIYMALNLNRTISSITISSTAVSRNA